MILNVFLARAVQIRQVRPGDPTEKIRNTARLYRIGHSRLQPNSHFSPSDTPLPLIHGFNFVRVFQMRRKFHAAIAPAVNASSCGIELSIRATLK